MIALDANILIREICPSDIHHKAVVTALSQFEESGQSICIFPQCLYEFWTVATRPIEANGLGLSVTSCQQHIRRLKQVYKLLPDRTSIIDEWEKLVVMYSCHGRISYDARIVAAMKTHGITKLMTLNVSDFRRFPEITLIDPTTFKTQTSL
jgi:predicted nucleic acid-binding protein